MENWYTFTAAVRGYHYYRKSLKPKENELLRCLFEENNPYDRFAIKTVTSEGTTVGHLPREISRIKKFFMDRGAVVSVQLTDCLFGFLLKSQLPRKTLRLPSYILNLLESDIQTQRKRIFLVAL